MSIFRKPKKGIQRRVFSAYDEEDAAYNVEEGKMDVTETSNVNPDSEFPNEEKKKKHKKPKIEDSKSKKALLSFADDEDEGEVFQVKKSSNSKKLMRMLDRERRKKKAKDEKPPIQEKEGKHEKEGKQEKDGKQEKEAKQEKQKQQQVDKALLTVPFSDAKFQIKTQNNNNVRNTDSIQTEIRTDDFVLVVKKSEPENVILNGRAALCAGRNDISSEEENSKPPDSAPKHRFSKPESLKLVLESGTIPDAAMIHAARKTRQKAREQGDLVLTDEQKPIKKGSRLVRDDAEDDASDEEERVDMNAITGIKEREERREKFYAVENEYSGDESDLEMNEWENQQIRKGVTGAQLVTVQQETMLSKFIIKPTNQATGNSAPQSTGTLLEQAYAKSCLEKPRQILLSTQKSESKPTGPRTPEEIANTIKKRLEQIKELNEKHRQDVTRIENDLKTIKLESVDTSQKAPVAATKYKFYQELRGYVTDLVECLDEKVPLIIDLEKRALSVHAKQANFLIERRRQDIRDQAKEQLTDSLKSGAVKKGPEYEALVRRAAEREGRRTRRRCEREKCEYVSSHLDGMSSDDEMADQDIAQYRTSLDQLEVEADDLFQDADDEYYKIDEILYKFEVWRKTDMASYKEAFVSLCLPKILGPLIRIQLVVWNPLDGNYQDIEKMDWYSMCMRYAYIEGETEESLAQDPDLRLVPTIIEKIILLKLTEIIEKCWDPLSTTQTLRLIGLIGRLGRDYPSMKETSKPLQALFNTILDKMKSALENDVFIPIFPKQMQEGKSSFFQRQFCSGVKLFRNIISWQGVIADNSLRDLAISALLNRYLLSAMRVCTPTDALSKAQIIINTLPTVWLQPESQSLGSLELFVAFIKHIIDQLDRRNPDHMRSYDKGKQILQKLHSH